jgi:drug/metabolite transporter (DMT)-like permease
LTLKVFLLIVTTDIAESVAQLFMKKGLILTGIDSVTFSNLAGFMSKALLSGFVWAGIGVYIFNFFVWLTVLSRVDLSIAFPVGSTSYILVPALAVIFLGETITPLRWAGIALIVCGIHFVSKSAGRKQC